MKTDEAAAAVDRARAKRARAITPEEAWRELKLAIDEYVASVKAAALNATTPAGSGGEEPSEWGVKPLDERRTHGLSLTETPAEDFTEERQWLEAAGGGCHLQAFRFDSRLRFSDRIERSAAWA